MSTPLVVISVVSEKNRQNVISAMKSIGKQWRESVKAGQREVVFAWMDGERWSKWLKSMYGVVDSPTAESPSVIVADHEVRPRIPPSRTSDLIRDLRTFSTTTSSRTDPRYG